MRVVLALLMPLTLLAQEPQTPAPAHPPVPPAAAADPEGTKLRAVIDTGHEWLRRHQDEDGRWSASMFVVHDPKGDVCTGVGKPDQDVFVTALVIKACYGLGQVGHNAPPYMTKGLNWLRTQVQADGSIGPTGGQDPVRSTAMAASVLAYETRHLLGENVQTMVASARWLRRQRQGGGLWSATGDDGDCDWLGSTLSLHFLAAPRKEPNEAEALQQLLLLGERDPPHGAVAGAAFLAAWYVPSMEKDHLSRCCELLARTPPSSHTPEAHRDYMAWYFTTLAMQFEAEAQWTPWWQALVHTATSLQRQDGAHAGSWDPDDMRGREGGRVYATAAMLLGLEVVWRKQYRDT